MLATSVFTTTTSTTNSNSLRNQLDIPKLLIKHGAMLDQCDHNNQTPLILATLENSLHIVDLLLSFGADIDAIDNECCTALTYAIKNQLSDLVEFLLQRNAATHILDKEGRSVLSLACSVGVERIVRLLMDKGLDEMHRDNFGWTPLHEIAHSGHLGLAETLLNYGSEIDASDNEGKTSLFHACQQGHLEMVQLLVGRNASVNARSHEGVSPFRIACLESREQVCAYLLERNAEINYKDPDGRSTLYCLVSANQNFDMIKFLLDRGANNSKDTEGRSCLHVAAMLGSEESVNLLLQHKANKESLDANGNTPLLSACWADKLSTARLLLNEKANINHCNKQGATALSIACQRGSTELANELLQRGADVYASSRNPIKLAHRGGFAEIVELLQIWSTMSYAEGKSSAVGSSLSVCVPRNSKSVDSFRASASRNRSMNEKSIMTAIATPNSFSSYISQKSAQSYQIQPPQTDYFANRSLLINLSESSDQLDSSAASSSLKYKLDEAKTSRFKQVKNKLLRKSTFVATGSERSSTILSSASNLYNSSSQQQAQTPSSKSVNSFRVFIASFNSNVDKQSKRVSANEGTLVRTPNQDDYLSASDTFSAKSKSANGSIMNMLRRKFKFLKNSSQDEGNEKTRQMQRSNTDILSYNHVGKHDTLNSKAENSASMNTLTRQQDEEMGTLSSAKKVENDDVAHIFNRNSLNDCLNPRRSFRDINSNVDVANQVQYKRPTCLQLNYFKKETSI
jgi:ankyrin repeat protein